MGQECLHLAVNAFFVISCVLLAQLLRLIVIVVLMKEQMKHFFL